MTHALTLTLPIKQDPETQQKLQHLKDIFTEQVQPAIDAALAQSHLVHFARVVVIDNKYIQVITEYEGPHPEYIEFFRRALTPVFAAIFDLADGHLDVNDPNAFRDFAKRANIQPLGVTTGDSRDMDGTTLAGYLFSAYGHKTVKDIQAALARAAAA